MAIEEERNYESVLNTNGDAVSRQSSAATLPSHEPLACTVVVEHLTYRVKHRAEPLVNDVSFIAKPGHVTAIIGPSGSGKTTLLNCIAGRVRNNSCMSKELSGRVFGVPKLTDASASRKLQSIPLSYVLSRETFCLGLSVEETLRYAARLLFPHASSKSISEKVTTGLLSVGLYNIRHESVGTRFSLTLSLDQTKRLSLAIALLVQPPVLIVDEPTTGLDAWLARETIALLKKIAVDNNCCVICSVHQPRTRTFELFDRVIFLNKGSVIYAGPSQTVMSYFEQLSSIRCPASWSCVDFVLDVVARLEREADEDAPSLSSLPCGEHGTVEARTLSLTPKESKSFSSVNVPVNIAEAFRQSDLAKTQHAEIEDACADVESRFHLKLQERRLERCTFGDWLGQTGVLIQRCFVAQARDARTILLLLLAALVQALVIGGLYWNFTATTNSLEVINPVAVTADYLTSPWFNATFGPMGSAFQPLLDVIDTGPKGDGVDLVESMILSNTFWQFLERVRDVYWSQLKMDTRGYPRYDYLDHLIVDSHDHDRKDAAVPSSDDRLALNKSTVARMMKVSLTYLQLVDYLYFDYDWTNGTKCYEDYPPELSDYTACFIRCCVEHLPDVSFPPFKLIKFKSVEDVLRYLKFLCWSDTPYNKQQSHGGATHRSLDAVRQQEQQQHASIRSTESLSTRSSTLSLFQEPSWLPQLLNDYVGHGGLRLVEALMPLTDRLWNAPHPWIRSSKGPLAHVFERFSTFFNSSLETVLAMFNLSGVVFFISLFLGFATYDILLKFPEERVLFNRETAKGHYSPSAYYIARMLADLPFQVGPSTVIGLVIFFMVGLYTLGEPNRFISTFFAYWGICLLVTFCAYGFGYMVSACASRLEVTLLIAPVFLMIWLCISGFFLRDHDLPQWILWFRSLSFYRWGFFAHESILFPPGGSFGTLPNELNLAFSGIVETRVWFCAVMLFVCGLGYRLVGFLFLKFCHRNIGLEC